MDNLSKADRRKNMQNIRFENTKPELLIMQGLRKRKIYFASHVKNIVGKPDIVFRRIKLAIFIDSDFFHYNKNNFVMPKTNVDYWTKKIENNIRRDKLVNKELKKQNWKVLRFWESKIKKNPDKILEKIIKTKNIMYLNIK